MAMFVKVTKSRNREMILASRVEETMVGQICIIPTILSEDLIILSFVLNIHPLFLTNNEKQKK